MTIIGDAYIAVKPDTKGFGKDAEAGVLGSVSSIAKKAGAILGGAFAVKKGFDFLSDSVDAARESNKIGAQTEAVIKSTGAAAKVSASQIGDLANALAAKTGIDDEAIQKGENLLLTFTNVKNEAGKGNDVFNQATKTLVDMGAALGTDASGSAIQLGKALNDPIKGIAALTRVGVTFTDQQKLQIKTMQEHGDIAGAQKVILAELNKEFGGSAAAQATASDRLKVTLGNLQEQLGNKLVPLLDRVATLTAEYLPAALDAGGRAFERIRAVIGPIIETVVELASVLGHAFAEDDTFGLTGSDGLEGKAASVGKALRDLFETAKQVFGILFQGDFKGGPLAEDSPFVSGLFRFREIAIQIAGFVEDHWKPILIGLGVAFAVLVAPVASVVAALAYAYIRFETVRDIVSAVIGAVARFSAFMQTDVAPVVAEVVAYVGEQFAHFQTFVDEHIGPAMEAAGHVFNALSDVVSFVVDAILYVWNRFGDNIVSIITTVFELVKSIVSTAIRVVRDVIDLVLSLINGDWGKAWDALKDIVVAVFSLIWEVIKSALSVAWELVKAGGKLLVDAFALAWDGIKWAASQAWDGIKTLAADAIDGIVGFVKGLPGRLLDLVASLASAGAELGRGLIGGLLDAIGAAGDMAADFAAKFANAVIGFVNKQFIDRINDTLELSVGLPDLLGGGSLKLDPKDIPHIPLIPMASGALVKARPGIGVGALLGEGTRDEAVLPLPAGLVEGLQAIASGATGATVYVTGATVSGAYATGLEVVRQMRAEQYRRTGR